MPDRLATAATVVVVAALMVLVAGCGSSGGSGHTGTRADRVTRAGRATRADRAGGTGRAPTTTLAPSPVGTTVRLHGPDGVQASVQLAGTVDPATPAAAYDAAPAGMRYVGVRFTLTNLAGAAISTDLSEDATVVEASGATVAPLVIDLADCPVVVFGGTVALPPGQPVTGCVAFELPSAAPITSVRLSLAPGPAGQATWRP